jgi:hypothetical protein
MDPLPPMPHAASDRSEMPSRDREVLKLAIRSLLMVHCKHTDPGALPRAHGVPQVPRTSH